MIIDTEIIENALFEGTAKEASSRTGIPTRTIEKYRAKETNTNFVDWSGMSLKKAIEIIEQLNKNEAMKERLQEMLDFIEAEFGALQGPVTDQQIAEFERTGQVKFTCYHDQNKYAIVAKNELEIKGYQNHYGTEDFEVYYYGE